MNNQKSYWDKIIKSLNILKPKYDLWLDKYKTFLEEARGSLIADLCCGWGDDTFYLTERGFEVVACDFSTEALKYIKKFSPSAKVMCFDLLDGLPFSDESINIVIADLCLHYFNWEDTVKVVNDIYRILSKHGHLLCRVNSTKDINYNAMQGEKLEDNYYLYEGCTKRSFNRKDLVQLFKDWKIDYISEYEAMKYHKPKVLWEIALSKQEIIYIKGDSP